jgi:hypothetical protein
MQSAKSFSSSIPPAVPVSRHFEIYTRVREKSMPKCSAANKDGHAVHERGSLRGDLI